MIFEFFSLQILVYSFSGGTGFLL